MSTDKSLLEARNSFLVDALDIIESLEEDFLLLEQHQSSYQNLDRIMRAFHSLKGTSAAVGFDELSQYCHSMESLLVFIRFNNLEITGLIVDLLLKANDQLKQSIDTLKRNHLAPIQIDRTINEINILLDELTKSKKSDFELDSHFLTDYLTDSTEQIEILENHLNQLESDLKNLESIHSVFRAFHTLKSSSGIVGYIPIEQLTHELESIITYARDGKWELTTEAHSLFYDALGVIRLAIDDLKSHSGVSKAALVNFDEMILICRTFAHKIGGQIGAPSVRVAEGEKESLTDTAPARGLPDASTFFEVQAENALAPSDQGELEMAHTVLSTEERSDHENELSEKKTSQTLGPRHRDWIKVDPERLDKLIDTIGELVIAESMVFQSADLKSIAQNDHIFKIINQLNKVTRQLHEVGLSLRMVPIRSVFKKTQRIVRDVSKRLGKQIQFSVHGEETELDKTLVEKIGDPLVHMIRNAIDHGIEKTAEERIAAGKSPIGSICLRAYLKGGNVWVEIQDDGRGLNRGEIVKKGIEKGLVNPNEHLSERDIYNLIFLPGFSTADKVTDLSGRGVGMDVVKKNIEEAHGQIDIKSEEGKGTTFTIRLPNTLAIIDGMIVYVGSERFVIPTQSIVRSIRLSDASIFNVLNKTGEVLNLGLESVPLMRLGRFFAIEENFKSPKEEALILVVEDGGKKIGLLADRISRQQQFVTKGLDVFDREIHGFSGGTILPDGQVGLILDVGELIKEVTYGNYVKFQRDFLEKLKAHQMTDGSIGGTTRWSSGA